VKMPKKNAKMSEFSTTVGRTVPCLSSADFSLTYHGSLATPLSFASGCNHDGVMTSVRRVASA
jgi:hypothetical protein